MLELSQWSKTDKKLLQLERWSCQLFEIPLLVARTASLQSGILYLSRSARATDSVPEHKSYSLFSSLSRWHSMLWFFFFFSPALAKCLPAGYDVRSCQSPQSGLWREREDSLPGPALLGYVHAIPTHRSTPHKRPWGVHHCTEGRLISTRLQPWVDTERKQFLREPSTQHMMCGFFSTSLSELLEREIAVDFFQNVFWHFWAQQDKFILIPLYWEEGRYLYS